MFGNEHWRSYRAADEIDVYCDLLENLQDRIYSLETRGKDEEVTLRNVQAVISSYAFEIAMKSLWALEHSDKAVPHTHDLLTMFDELGEDSVKALEILHLTRRVLEMRREPFVSSRYSMEYRDRDITVYPSRTLRPLAQLLRDKTKETRESLLKPLRSSNA
jgi:HEPN domain-containing protein